MPCKLLQAAFLVSYIWFIKRDVAKAVRILDKIISEDKHNQSARILLSSIYMTDKEYKTIEYGKRVVQLLADNIWYCNLDGINLLIGTINHYRLVNNDCYFDACEMRAKLLGKDRKILVQLIKFIDKYVGRPIDFIWKIFFVSLSYAIALVFGSVRFLIFYVPNLIRMLFR